MTGGTPQAAVPRTILTASRAGAIKPRAPPTPTAAPETAWVKPAEGIRKSKPGLWRMNSGAGRATRRPRPISLPAVKGALDRGRGWHGQVELGREMHGRNHPLPRTGSHGSSLDTQVGHGGAKRHLPSIRGAASAGLTRKCGLARLRPALPSRCCGESKCTLIGDGICANENATNCPVDCP